jgi:hypothetical protein
MNYLSRNRGVLATGDNSPARSPVDTSTATEEPEPNSKPANRASSTNTIPEIDPQRAPLSNITPRATLSSRLSMRRFIDRGQSLRLQQIPRYQPKDTNVSKVPHKWSSRAWQDHWVTWGEWAEFVPWIIGLIALPIVLMVLPYVFMAHVIVVVVPVCIVMGAVAVVITIFE